MKSTRITILFLMICVLTFFVKCKKDKDKTDTKPTETSFDKAAMLNNIGVNLIIPAYADLKTGVDSLKYYSDLFTENPTSSTLIAFQNSFSQAYLLYQRVSTFELGPADTELLRANFNTFPCDTAQINSKIAAGDLNISTIADLDAKGFPALDFLLFRNNNNSNYIVSLFTTNPSATNAKSYLTTLVTELKSKTDAVNTGWNPAGGNYNNTFKGSTGNDVGSSTGILVNQLNFDYEILKNAKIGIPLGKRTNGAILPEKAEAFYSGKSLDLVIEHFKNLENIYLGRSAKNVDGLGLDDYLVSLNAQHSSGNLNDAIKKQFTSINTKLAAIPGPLSQAIINNPTVVDQAYAEILQLVVLIKIDLPAATGVLITYADNDGD